MQGLRECGVEPVAINVLPDRRIRRAALDALALRYVKPDLNPVRAIRAARQPASLSPLLGRLESRTAQRALRGNDLGLTGLIQIGSSYQIRSDVPTVTLEDMTVVQARLNDYPGWRAVSNRTLRRRMALQQTVYDTATACCVMTPWAAQSVVSDYGIDPRKVHVVGVGNNHPPVGNIERDWRRPCFLFVGSDWAWKNGDAVVRAFGELRREFANAELHLVGSHPPIDQVGVVDHGPLSMEDPAQRATLTRLFETATCHVMPSRCDAAGIVYVEAAAAGIPSICSDAGGSGFLVGDGGLVVPVGDDAALLDAMRRLCDPGQAAAAGKRAQARSELFTWPAVAERLLRAVRGQSQLPFID